LNLPSNKHTFFYRIRHGYSVIFAMVFVPVFLVCSCSHFQQHADGIHSEEKVEIFRDTYAIPHIFATSRVGMYYGAGWTEAEDEAPLLILELAAAQGRLSEFIHPADTTADMKIISRDIRTRAFGYYDIAGDWKQIPEDVRNTLGAYAAGFNDYLSHLEQDGNLPGRYRSETGVDYTGVIRKFGRVTIRDLVAFGIMLNVEEALSLMSHRELATMNLSFRGIRSVRSNAVAGTSKITLFGAPFIYGDPHNPWYGNQHLVHMSIPGANFLLRMNGPFMSGGRAGGTAVAFTRNYPDVADVFTVKLKPDNHDQYLFDGNWVPFAKKEIDIDVRGRNPVSITLYYSRHGWVWDYPYEEEDRHFAHAVRIAVLDTSTENVPLRYIEQRMRQAWSESIDDFQHISEIPYHAGRNMILADDSGNIAYYWYGRVPVRASDIDSGIRFSYNVPLDGSTAASEWRGGVWSLNRPEFQLPFMIDPPSGFVSNANGVPWEAYSCDANPGRPPHLPWHIVPNGIDGGTREKLIRNLLCKKKKWSLEDLKTRLAFNTFCPDAKNFIIAVNRGWDTHGTSLSGYGISKNAAELDAILRSWDAFADIESTGMTVMFHFRRLSALPWFDASYVPSLDEMRAYLKDLDRVAGTMSDLYGTLEVPWGDVHIIRQGGEDFPLPGGTRDIQSLMLAYREPAGSITDSSSRDAMYGDMLGENDPAYIGKVICDFGSSFIHIHLMDPDNPRSFVVTPRGQIDNELFPESTHLLQQTRLFSRKELMDVPLTRDRVLDNLCPWGEQHGHEHPAITKLHLNLSSIISPGSSQ